MVWVILCAVLLQRAMSASTLRRQIALAIVSGGMCFIAQLFTAELGLLTLSAALIVLGFYAALAHFQSRFNYGLGHDTPLRIDDGTCWLASSRWATC